MSAARNSSFIRPASVGSKYYLNTQNLDAVLQLRQTMYDELKAGGYFMSPKASEMQSLPSAAE